MCVCIHTCTYICVFACMYMHCICILKVRGLFTFIPCWSAWTGYEIKFKETEFLKCFQSVICVCVYVLGLTSFFCPSEMVVKIEKESLFFPLAQLTLRQQKELCFLSTA